MSVTATSPPIVRDGITYVPTLVGASYRYKPKPVISGTDESTIGTFLDPVLLSVTNVATMNAIPADKRSARDRITLPQNTSNGMTYEFDGTAWQPLRSITVVVSTPAVFNGLSEEVDGQQVRRLSDNKRFIYSDALGTFVEELTTGDGWTDPANSHTWAKAQGAAITPLTQAGGNIPIDLGASSDQSITMTAAGTFSTVGTVNDTAASTPFTIWIDRTAARFPVINALQNNGNVSLPDTDKVFFTFVFRAGALVTLSAGIWE